MYLIKMFILQIVLLRTILYTKWNKQTLYPFPKVFIIYKPFYPDNRNTYKTNANPKINILMFENIGQRRLNFFSGIFRCFILSSFSTYLHYLYLKEKCIHNINVTENKTITIFPPAVFLKNIFVR